MFYLLPLVLAPNEEHWKTILWVDCGNFTVNIASQIVESQVVDIQTTPLHSELQSSEVVVANVALDTPTNAGTQKDPTLPYLSLYSLNPTR